jgi:hypothetical protein
LLFSQVATMTPTAAPASLDEVLAYRNPGVVRRYLKERGGTQAEAEGLFRETLKWLYLCDRAAADGFDCAMTEDLERVDWMWHAFVLFTRDYAEFCHRHFGTFIHHVPEDEGEGEAGRRRSPPRRRAAGWNGSSGTSTTRWARRRCGPGTTSAATPPPPAVDESPGPVTTRGSHSYSPGLSTDP